MRRKRRTFLECKPWRCVPTSSISTMLSIDGATASDIALFNGDCACARTALCRIPPPHMGSEGLKKYPVSPAGQGDGGRAVGRLVNRRIEAPEGLPGVLRAWTINQKGRHRSLRRCTWVLLARGAPRSHRAGRPVWIRRRTCAHPRNTLSCRAHRRGRASPIAGQATFAGIGGGGTRAPATT